MNEDEIKIIEIFRGSKKMELSTTEIVQRLYPKKYKKILREAESYHDDKEKQSIFKRKKAQLHRKTLYHINKLIEDEILKVSQITGKNQKHFSLTIGSDEDIIIGKNNRKKIIIAKPNLPAMPIEGYEQKNLIKKFEEATWINRTNATMIQCKRVESIDKLKEIIIESFSYINDAVGINDFESIAEITPLDKVKNFFEFMEQECSDYGKILSFTIDFTNIKKDSKIIEIVKAFSEIIPSSMNMIFDVTSKELQKYESLMETVVENFSKYKIQVHIKNQECHDAPYIIGKAGPYTYKEEEWNYYREEYKNKIPNIICGQSTISVDVEEFFNFSKNSYQFRQFILNIAKSLLHANSMQRSRSGEYFKYFIELNKPHTTNLFSYSKSYIRFWNYGWKGKSLNPEIILKLIKSIKIDIDEFCNSEETIYRACGMPTRFRIGFSCAFRDANKEEFSEEKFKKLQIRKIEDLYSPEIKKLIFEKEEIFDMFDGGDRLRFYRRGEFEPKEIIREFNIIINTYKIPFFCYDFGEIRGNDMSLVSFIEK